MLGRTVLPLESFRAAPPHPQDPFILNVAKTVFSSLNINSPPQTLLWVSVVPKSIFDGSTIEGLARGNTRSASSDRCRFYKDAILLAEGMRGKLEPEEWESLIASSVLFYKKFRTRLLVRLVAFNWAPLGLLLAGFFGALFVAAISGAPASVAFLFVPFLFLGVILVEGAYNQSVKNSWLLADQQSAELVGRLGFLAVLKKLESLGLPDIKRRSARKRITRFLLVDSPSIEERVRNVEYRQVPGIK